jgi:hypothetical protein
VHLAFDIFQGLGIALAIGIRPFIPALAVSALASGGVQIHFQHTDYSFLQGTPFLLATVIGAITVSVLERQLGPDAANSGPFPSILLMVGFVLAALLFAGALAQHHHAVWPGWIAGVLCAGLGAAATRPLLGRVRARLDDQAVSATILYAEAAALVIAVLAAVAPPVGPLAVLAMAWLLWAGRRREGQKYAGLRILR